MIQTAGRASHLVLLAGIESLHFRPRARVLSDRNRERSMSTRRTPPMGYLVCRALLCLLASGCLAAAVGACAAGAGVTANAYSKGKVCHLYAADLNDAVAAVHAALTELGMPLEKENVKA